VRFSLHTIFFSSLLIITAGFLFYPFFLELYTYWDSEPESSSALMIPLFAAYMLWVQRDKLIRSRINTNDNLFSKSGFVLLMSGLALFAFGRFLYILSLQAFAFVVIAVGVIRFVYGNDLFRITAAPIIFLLFMLPIPVSVFNTIAEPLKQFIAYLSTSILLLFNVPLLKDGNVIHLPSISLLVHESCSGIRTTISTFAISFAFAYMFLRSYPLRIAFLIMAIPVGILTNILRVVVIGLLASVFNGDVAMKFHGNAWAFVTPVGIATIFIVGYLFRCYELRNS